MGLVRLIVFGAIGLTIIYFLVSLYSRSVRREKLEKECADQFPRGADEARKAYVDAGMKEYNQSIRPKLILLVYVVPTVVVITIHVLTTYY